MKIEAELKKGKNIQAEKRRKLKNEDEINKQEEKMMVMKIKCNRWTSCWMMRMD